MFLVVPLHLTGSIFLVQRRVTDLKWAYMASYPTIQVEFHLLSPRLVLHNLCRLILNFVAVILVHLRLVAVADLFYVLLEGFVEFSSYKSIHCTAYRVGLELLVSYKALHRRQWNSFLNRLCENFEYHLSEFLIVVAFDFRHFYGYKFPIILVEVRYGRLYLRTELRQHCRDFFFRDRQSSHVCSLFFLDGGFFPCGPDIFLVLRRFNRPVDFPFLLLVRFSTLLHGSFLNIVVHRRLVVHAVKTLHLVG